MLFPRYEQSVAVATLLNAGCSPNLTDREAMTPLHMAAKKGNLQVAKVLLRNRGTDVVGIEMRCGSRHGLSLHGIYVVGIEMRCIEAKIFPQ